MVLLLILGKQVLRLRKSVSCRSFKYFGVISYKDFPTHISKVFSKLKAFSTASSLVTLAHNSHNPVGDSRPTRTASSQVSERTPFAVLESRRVSRAKTTDADATTVLAPQQLAHPQEQSQVLPATRGSDETIDLT